MTTFTVIDETRPTDVPATIEHRRVRLSVGAVRDALGWELKPQGLCKDDRCVRVDDRRDLVTDAGIDLAELAAVLGRPLALDLDERVACVGAAAADRGAALASLIAPDFALPDLAGRIHRLSDQRGRKILLAAYASW